MENEILITRSKLMAQAGRNVRFQWKWLYSYTYQGKTVTYDTHLASLRSYLKRTFPGVSVREEWK